LTNIGHAKNGDKDKNEFEDGAAEGVEAEEGTADEEDNEEPLVIICVGMHSSWVRYKFPIPNPLLNSAPHLLLGPALPSVLLSIPHTCHI